jgi:hypothetical protein
MLHGHNRFSQVLALSKKTQIAKIRPQKIIILYSHFNKGYCFCLGIYWPMAPFQANKKNTPLDWVFILGDTNLVSIQKISKIFL